MHNFTIKIWRNKISNLPSFQAFSSWTYMLNMFSRMPIHVTKLGINTRCSATSFLCSLPFICLFLTGTVTFLLFNSLFCYYLSFLSLEFLFLLQRTKFLYLKLAFYQKSSKTTSNLVLSAILFSQHPGCHSSWTIGWNFNVLSKWTIPSFNFGIRKSYFRLA